MIQATDDFIMQTASKQHLLDLGYRYYLPSKTGSHTLYIYRFPVYKYKNYTVIECDVVTEVETGITKLDFYDKSTRVIYYPFYGMLTYQYSKEFFKIMDKTVKKELRKLGIRWK